MIFNFVTCGQMKVLEKRANESGLSYYNMMENAGTLSAEFIAEKYQMPVRDAFVLIFCGKGNNGGDGFVTARKLLEQGAEVLVVLTNGIPVSEDAKTNFDLLTALSVEVIDMSETPDFLLNLKHRPDIIVDAIYGTGFYGALSANGLKAASYINQQPAEVLVFALDIPSGLGGDSLSEEQIDSRAIRADYTITFHNRKPVHVKAFSRKYCGETLIADIGISEEALW